MSETVVKGPLAALSDQERALLLEQVKASHRRATESQVSLDMTRGKPSSAQLDLADDLIDGLAPADAFAEDGTDCRNYGGLAGLPEVRQLFADMLGTDPQQVAIGGNSSLELMHDTLCQALLRGVPGSPAPWLQQGPVRFLCPAPGYDRHFFLCDYLGIEMVPVPLGEHGPDLARVAELLAEDEHIKGMFCVPRYSNPTGIVYSEDTVERLASLPARAADFRLYWDNAYVVHHLTTEPRPLADIVEACAGAGNADRAFVFASTSKISLAGSGLSAFAGSAANVAWFLDYRGKQTIGPDKLNQLRHARFFGGVQGVHEHMRRHASILKPKFDAVDEILGRRLGELEVATWTRPEGGYFVSVDTEPGCARRVVELAAQAGLKLTPAGATFPYGRDPEDRNLRLAPSMPPLEEVEAAVELIADCILLASLELR